MIVVDANVIAYFCIPGPLTAAARRLAETELDWRAPALWRSELRNALAGEIRRRQLSVASALARMAEAETAIAVTHEADTGRVLELIATSQCTAYDVEYVALAQQLHVALVTMDRELLRAFPEIAQPLPG